MPAAAHDRAATVVDADRGAAGVVLGAGIVHTLGIMDREI